LHKSPSRDRDLALTVAGVTVMSTVAMIVYPVLSQWLHHCEVQAGIFLGSSIHDVAQVVGAGYSISDEVGNNATLVKLMRVSALLPVVLTISLIFRKQNTEKDNQKPSLFPPFLIAHALVAIGLKTDLKSIASVGKMPLIHLISLTLFLALTSLILIQLFT